MSIEVHEGAVRLDRGSFQELLDGADVPPELLEVTGVAEALAAVRSPAVVIHVDIASRGVQQTHRVWVDGEMAAMLLAVRDEEHQLVAVPPAFLASGLARVLRIGPHRTDERASRAVEEDVVADLFADSDILRASALETLGADFAWNLGLSWPDGDRGLCVVDGREGSWIVTGDEEQTCLEPATSTDIWRRLTTLLEGIDPASVNRGA